MCSFLCTLLHPPKPSQLLREELSALRSGLMAAEARRSDIAAALDKIKQAQYGEVAGRRATEVELSRALAEASAAKLREVEATAALEKTEAEAKASWGFEQRLVLGFEVWCRAVDGNRGCGWE